MYVLFYRSQNSITKLEACMMQTSVLVFLLFLACGNSINLLPIDRREKVQLVNYDQLGAVNHFQFTGSIQSVTVPAATNVISVHMWGGGGYREGVSLGSSGAYVHGYLSVSSGSTLDLFVGGGGGYPSPSYGHQWNNSVGRLAKRRRGRARLNERDVVLGSSICRSEGVGDGGKSVLQIDGEDVLTAAGGRARSPHVSSLNSNARHGSLSLSFNNGLCKGQHSKYFDPTACGMGGSTHSGAFGQHGLVVIELFPSPTESNLVENSSEANRISKLPSELVERTSYLFLPSQPPLSQPTQRPSSGFTGGAQPIVVLSPISSFLFTVFILCVGVVFIISICFYGYSPCWEYWILE